MTTQIVYRDMDMDAAGKTKREDGKDFPSGDFFYVPDAEKPSTWKLRKTGTPGSAPDATHVGAAAAALGPGYRGQKVSIPAKDRAAVKTKVRAAWKKLHPGKKNDEMPSGIRAEAIAEATATREALSHWVLDGMGLDVPDLEVEHPNRTPFSGVLTKVDEASDSSPGGAMGHRVVIPRSVAEEALPTLLLMGVNVSMDGKGHDKRKKIGVITEAWIEGNDVKVEGYLYARDFPTEVTALRAASKDGKLGMSYEIAEVLVADTDQPVWEVQHLVFTGAAILERHSAAYKSTRLIAASEELIEEEQMNAAQLAEAAAKAAEVVQANTGQNNVHVVVAGDDYMKTLYKMLDNMGALAGMVDDMRYMRAMLESACGTLEKVQAGLNASNVEASVEEDDKGETAMKAETEHASAAPGMAAVSALSDVVQGLVAQMDEMGKQIKAMGELITDKAETGRELVTDTEATRGGQLKTDSMQREADGGPVRTTLAAGNEYEQEKAKQEAADESTFAGKFDAYGNPSGHSGYPVELIEAGFEPGKKYSTPEADAHMKGKGITDLIQRVDLKNRLVTTGQLA